MFAVTKFSTCIRTHHQRLGLSQVLVRSETVVDMHTAFVGNHIRALAAGNQCGVETLTVVEPIHIHSRGFISIESVQNISGLVDGVLSHPGAGRVRGDSVRDHIETDRAVAAAFDATIGGLTDNGKITGNPVGVRFDHLTQTVLFGGDFLVVVEHIGEVDFRSGSRCEAIKCSGEIQHHRIGGLHIRGTTAPQHTVFGMGLSDFLANQRITRFKPLRREVVDYRHSVEMTGQNHTIRLAKIGAGHHRVAVTADGQMLLFIEESLNLIGERTFMIGDRKVLHNLGEQAVQLLSSGIVAVQFKRHEYRVPRDKAHSSPTT